MKAVGYVRVSQADESVENQRVKIEEFCRARGLELVSVFADIDVSDVVPPRERPQYRAMLEFCKLNNVRVIVFYDLSRLARSVEEGLNELKRLLDEGFNIYFAEALHSMRKESLAGLVSQHVELSKSFKIRDEKSVKRITSGLLKLLFPDKSFSREELRRVVELAVEYRQRIRDWLHKVDPGEFPKEKLVATVRD